MNGDTWRGAVDEVGLGVGWVGWWLGLGREMGGGGMEAGWLDRHWGLEICGSVEISEVAR